jgi:hypothetical protein
MTLGQRAAHKGVPARIVEREPEPNRDAHTIGLVSSGEGGRGPGVLEAHPAGRPPLGAYAATVT